MSLDKYGNALRPGDPVSVVSGHSEYFGEYVGKDADGLRIRVPDEFGGGTTTVPRSKVYKEGGRRKRKSASRSKPKRAGAKKRTVTRLKRVRVGAGRRGFGVMRHGAAPAKKQRGPKSHLVWLKVPMNEAEVYGRYSSKRDADRVAAALQKRADRDWSSYGRCDVWVESPGTIEQRLRQLHESYEQG